MYVCTYIYVYMYSHICIYTYMLICIRCMCVSKKILQDGYNDSSVDSKTPARESLAVWWGSARPRDAEASEVLLTQTPLSLVDPKNSIL